MESFEIPNARGLRIRGNIHLPSQSSSAPALIVLHGFCGHQNETHILHFAESAPTNGIVGIRFDASGFGESDGNVEEDFRVSKYLEDARTVLRFVQQHPRIQSTRIGICGHSLGSSLAVVLAAQEKSIAACSAIQPCTKLTRKTSTSDFPTWKEKGKLLFTSEVPHLPSFYLPWAFAEDADKFDASQWSARVQCPYQIMYGTADNAVVPSDTLSIFKNAPKGTELVELRGMGHGFKEFPDEVEEVTEKLFEFMGRQLTR